MATTLLPEWRSPPPPKAEIPKLSVYNSLTRTKTPFIPLDPEGKRVKWYACGPTVYDDSHLGHARNYVSQDVIRRIMSDYFKFDIEFVMNITDVDDKIILAARQLHLLEKFLAEKKDDEVREATLKAFGAYVKKNLTAIDADITAKDFDKAVLEKYGNILKQNAVLTEQETKTKMHINTARDAAEALTQDLKWDEYSKKAAGVLRPYLDSFLAETVKGDDHGIFTTLTKKYERRFFDDMKALNVRDPDKLTRVTEYGPQIVDFVKQIEDHGFAYAHDGSVYYDTTAWEKSGGVYARLEPWNRNDKDLQADGEGSLSAKTTGFKKSGADFALWKASKAGEPTWSSPWGEGRPGWHIECSAMASDVLGKRIDIHSGGIDLAFPHHDNELAQSEAFWSCSGKDSEQWVNYFLHMGHLGIAGAKMSKSLKNFTTIKDALETGLYTPRSLRIVFLLGAWKDGLEISTRPGVASDTNATSLAWEEKVDNFFLKVRDLQRHPTKGSANGTNGVANETDLSQLLETSKQRLDEALRDSFDTPAAMRVISELVTAYNSAAHVPDATSIEIGKWITEIVAMFGLDASYQPDAIGWSGIDIPVEAKAFVYPAAELRDTVRAQAKQKEINLDFLNNEDPAPEHPDSSRPYYLAYCDFRQKLLGLYREKAAPAAYLAASDELRDTTLWNLGIYLEDRDGQPALVRPLSASLRKERDEKEARAAAKTAAAAKKKAEAEAKERERLEKGKISHLEMFKGDKEFSEWDAEGMPTKDAEGKEVAKSRTKKLRKQWEQQKKLHEEFQKMQLGHG